MSDTESAQDHMAMSKAEQMEDVIEYPPTKKVIPVMAAAWLSFFVVALDRTIIGVAIPTISKRFDSFGDISWYEAGFLFPLCVLQLSFGRIYAFYSVKWVLIINVAIFEIGSLVCATAPSSNALIVGRVITGIGAAAIPPGCFVLISFLVPKQKRPKYLGFMGSVFGITSILGPILGGVFTSINWRWCFWINVPVGAISIAMLAVLTPKCDPPVKRSSTWKGKFFELDPLGFSLIAPCLVCLIIAVQFGGTKYPWNSATTIVLFVVSGVLGVAFCASQIWRGDRGTMPPRIILQRTVLVASIASVGIGAVIVLFPFFLPIWYQVIQDKSPESSGLALIPLLLSVVLCVIGGGIFTSTVGYYNPLLIMGSAIMMVGAGLLSTWTVHPSQGAMIGYLIIIGIGEGVVLQIPAVAAQAVLSKTEVSTGLAIVNLFNFLGGTLFVTVAQNLFENGLIKRLDGIIPDLDPAMLTNAGATSVRNMVPSDKLPVVLEAYNDSMKSIWYLAIGLAGLVFLVSWGMEWKSVKEQKADDEESMKEEVEESETSN